MSLQFSGIVENKRHLGFDSIRPKEIFCRKGGSRALKVPPNDPGIYEFKSSNPHVATAESVVNPPPGEWHVEIKGKARGTAIITSHRDGQQEDEVTVYVYPDRVVKVNFYRCYDTIAREAPYFTHSDVPDALARINALYKYQAGIVFESHLLKTPIVDPQVDLRTPNQTEEQYRKVFAYMKLVCDQFDTSSSHRNIFLVRKWSAKDRPGEAAESAMRDVFGTTHKNCCIIEDMPTKDLTVILMAHELGHTLGANHASISYPEALMAEKLGDTHLHIYPKQVREMRGDP